MNSPENYSSPTEARAKRRGGRGFYRDRGLPYVDTSTRSGTAYRDEHRNPEEREAAELGRSLADLAIKFPRFKPALNRVRNHVLVQARSEDWKCAAILECLGVEPLSVEEIIEETDLDRQSVDHGLASLEGKGRAAKCNRTGAPVVIRRDSKPAEKVYWLRKQEAEGRRQKAGG